MSDSDSELDLDPYEEGEDFVLLGEDEDDDDIGDDDADASEDEDDTAASDGDDTDTAASDDEGDASAPGAALAAESPAPRGDATGLDVLEVVPEGERLLPARLNMFEYARVLSTRSDAIARGSEPLVDLRPNDDAIAIARREITQRRCPLRIIRVYEHYDHVEQKAHKRAEYWRVAEMELPVI